MTFDTEIKPALDKEKDTLQGILDFIRDRYEAGFSKIEKSPNFMSVPLGTLLPYAPHDVNVVTRTAEHREIGGTGGSTLEALEDWLGKFKNLPRQGDALFWRVSPEADWWYDFPTRRVTWKIYARLAIFE